MTKRHINAAIATGLLLVVVTSPVTLMILTAFGVIR